jgi:hypothetical protein
MSIGSKLGRGAGRAGAFVVEIGYASGRFGADFVDGCQTGYVDQRAVLDARRVKLDAERKAMLAAAAAELATEPATPAMVAAAAMVASPKRARAI